METIRIGTRSSKLALWQAEWIASQLQAAGLATELVLMETKGDKIQEVSIAKIGSKGVFTEELEAQLADGSIHIAVHSAKDMQSRLPAGFELIAFTEREKTCDVIIADRAIDLNDPELVLGTSSTRRVATFRHFYPHIHTVDMRGNLQTRIAKMCSGVCHGLVLAYAGVHRMAYDELIRVELSEDEFTPAVGQGSVAIECHERLSAKTKARIREIVNHPPTEKCLLAERAYLARLEGGCSIPVFALARLQADGQIGMTAGIVSLDGAKRLTKSDMGHDPQVLGLSLADALLSAGGDRILQSIRAGH